MLYLIIYARDCKLNHSTCLMAEVSDDHTYSSFLACGATNDYYHTPESELVAHDFRGGLTKFLCDGNSYIGVVRRYTGDTTSPGFSTIVMTPEADYIRANLKNALGIWFLVSLLVVLSAFCCVYVSHRYLKPVLKGLEQIKAESSQRKRTDILEINNVLDFLSSNIRESTLKYHNSHIYETLNVKSRKELLIYISLMNRSKGGERESNGDIDAKAE